ncbi:MAG: hypothetical protein Q4G63_10045 [Bacteroidia bacterium]|nr:hypothetical protein [Bacteroidia bacterium]
MKTNTLNEKGIERLNRIVEYLDKDMLNDSELLQIRNLARAIFTICWNYSDDKNTGDVFEEIQAIADAIADIIDNKREWTVELLSDARNIKHYGLIKN